jgi:outer membrane receptor protein involved in Fe transport
VDLHSRTATGSAFVTNTWTAPANINITASARFNWTTVTLRDQIGTALTGDHQFNRINPAAGLTYQVRPRVNVYASYTESSRVPTPVELTCADPEDPCRLPNAFVSDPPLDQIVAGTWEAGARGTARGAAWSVSLFRTAASDDIIFVSSGTLRGEGHFENVARTLRTGLEAGLDYSVEGRFAAFATYTLQRASFGTDLRIASQFHPLAEASEIFVPAGSRMPGVPAHSAKFGVAVSATDQLNLGFTVRTQSGQHIRGDEANLLPRLPAFAVVSAHARQRAGKRVTVVAQVQNLFGAEYYTFGVLGDAALLGEAFEDDPRFYSPAMPRAGWIGLELRF